MFRLSLQIGIYQSFLYQSKFPTSPKREYLSLSRIGALSTCNGNQRRYSLQFGRPLSNEISDRVVQNGFPFLVLLEIDAHRASIHGIMFFPFLDMMWMQSRSDTGRDSGVKI